MMKLKNKMSLLLGNACLLVMIIFMTMQNDLWTTYIESFYKTAIQEIFPGYNQKGQPIFQSTLAKFIVLYRRETVPILGFQDDYKGIRSEELVTYDDSFFTTNEEDVEEKDTKKNGNLQQFQLNRWFQTSYLRKHVYQIDSTTSITNNELNGKVLLSKNIKIEKSQKPQILIYHTHGSEAYKDSQKGKKSDTVIGVGDVLAKELEETYHIHVIHDRNIYDYVNGKEERSKAYSYAAKAIESKLKQYPSIQVILDIHRDGVKESTKLITRQNNQSMAQIMFFNGMSRTAKNGDIKYLKNPNLQTNLAFSLQMQAAANKKYPGFTRKIYIKGYRYNLHYRGRSMLVEVGAQNNTKKQAKRSMKILAQLLNEVLYETKS